MSSPTRRMMLTVTTPLDLAALIVMADLTADEVTHSWVTGCEDCVGLANDYMIAMRMN